MGMKRAAANRQAPEHGVDGDAADNLVLDVRAQHTIITLMQERPLAQVTIAELGAEPNHHFLRVPFCGQKTLEQIRDEINRYLRRA